MLLYSSNNKSRTITHEMARHGVALKGMLERYFK
jgi:hypothetical protein